MLSEKHIPVFKKTEDGGTEIIVGSIPHPMLPEHYIVMIEVIRGNETFRRFLNPGEAPEAVVPFKIQKGDILREYCNVHGLWQAVIE